MNQLILTTKMHTLVYLAGPYIAKDRDQIACNMGKLYFWFVALTHKHRSVVCPPLASWGMEDTHPDKDWMPGCLAQLTMCDTLYIVPEWEMSKGTKYEIEYFSNYVYRQTIFLKPEMDGDMLMSVNAQLFNLAYRNPQLANLALEYSDFVAEI